MEVDSQSPPAGNTGNFGVVNQQQETLNIGAEMPEVTKRDIALETTKISKKANQTKVLKVKKDKNEKKDAKVTKRAKKATVHRILKNEDGKKVLKTTKTADKEILTAVRCLKDPKGSSLADIKKFIVSQHKEGNLGEKTVNAVVKDAVNREILTKLDGRYKIAKRRNTRKRSVSAHPKRTNSSKSKGNTGNFGVVNQQQETLNMGAEMPEVTKRDIALEATKISKKTNQTKVLKVEKDKNEKEDANVTKRAKKATAHTHTILKNEDGKKVLKTTKTADKEILTTVRCLKDPKGSSLADIKKFILSQHKEGNLGGKTVNAVVKDAVNRGILIKLDGRYKIAERRKTLKRSVSANPKRKQSAPSRNTPKQ